MSDKLVKNADNENLKEVEGKDTVPGLKEIVENEAFNTMWAKLMEHSECLD